MEEREGGKKSLKRDTQLGGRKSNREKIYHSSSAAVGPKCRRIIELAHTSRQKNREREKITVAGKYSKHQGGTTA